MTGLEVRRARPDELARCLAIRRAVFVDEQGVPLDEEMDAHDAACTHFVALAAGEAVGTARLRVTDSGRLKAERVAVRRSFRRAGVGRALMRALEDEARARGAADLLLNAQVPVVAFYERLGWCAEGPEFLEAGIPHRAMRKPLT